jgi:hypothetical protein
MLSDRAALHASVLAKETRGVSCQILFRYALFDTLLNHSGGKVLTTYADGNSIKPRFRFGR